VILRDAKFKIEGDNTMAVGNSVDPVEWFAEQIGACEPDLLVVP
jgi:hypothetical protein